MLIISTLRWIIPSIGDLIFIALLGLLAFTTLSVRLLGDAGIGWHIRTGQLILATHAIPHPIHFLPPWPASPGSLGSGSTMRSSAGWISRGSERCSLLRGRRSSRSDLSHRHFVCFCGGARILLVALALVLLAVSASMIHFLARPHVVSWLFAVLWFWILDSSERKANRLSPMMAAGISCGCCRC